MEPDPVAVVGAVIHPAKNQIIALSVGPNRDSSGRRAVRVIRSRKHLAETGKNYSQQYQWNQKGSKKAFHKLVSLHRRKKQSNGIMSTYS
jgi:hypothetical protein